MPAILSFSEQSKDVKGMKSNDGKSTPGMPFLRLGLKRFDDCFRVLFFLTVGLYLRMLSSSAASLPKFTFLLLVMDPNAWRSCFQAKTSADASVVGLNCNDGFGTKPSRLYMAGLLGLGLLSFASGLTVVATIEGGLNLLEAGRLGTGHATASLSSVELISRMSACFNVDSVVVVVVVVREDLL